MTVRVVNESSHPTKTVERLVRSTLADLDVRSCTVRIVDSKSSWTSGWWESGGWSGSQILIRLVKPGVTPSEYIPYHRIRESGKRFPLADWKEALVAVAAHEGEHHRQFFVLGERSGRRARKTRDGRVLRPGSGRRRVDVELRCDLAAYRAWKRYRLARRLDIPA